MTSSSKPAASWKRPPPKSYEDLDESCVSTALMNALRDAFKEKNFPVYVYGAVGVGKSYAAALVYARFTASRVVFTRFCDLMADCSNADIRGEVEMKPSAGDTCVLTSRAWWKWIEDIDLLVIDEVGTGSPNVYRQELFWKVLECRKRKPTLMTGNLNIDEIQSHFTARISSRFSAGTLIEFVGKDRRADGAGDRSVIIKVKDSK